MRVARIIKRKGELWELLAEIKKLDEHTFIACLLGAYAGARFRELKALTFGELKRPRIHLGTQIYLGTGRSVLIADAIKPFIKEFYDKQPSDKKSLLERVDGSFLKLTEVNRIVIQAAERLNLKDITITSFRKSCGHELCKLLDNEQYALDGMGFKTKSNTNLHTMFDFKKGGWE